MEYECLYGFAHISGELTHTCGGSLNWEGIAPMCQGWYKQNTCGRFKAHWPLVNIHVEVLFSFCLRLYNNYIRLINEGDIFGIFSSENKLPPTILHCLFLIYRNKMQHSKRRKLVKHTQYQQGL